MGMTLNQHTQPTWWHPNNTCTPYCSSASAQLSLSKLPTNSRKKDTLPHQQQYQLPGVRSGTSNTKALRNYASTCSCSSDAVCH
jgi:hypothetical protein